MLPSASAWVALAYHVPVPLAPTQPVSHVPPETVTLVTVWVALPALQGGPTSVHR